MTTTIKSPAQLSQDVIEANYGVGTDWEEPNEYGEAGFTRAQAESDISADDVRKLIEDAIAADRRQMTTPLPTKDQILAELTRTAMEDPDTGWLSNLAAAGLEYDEADESITVGHEGTIDVGHIAGVIEHLQNDPVPEDCLLVQFATNTEYVSGDWEGSEPGGYVTSLGDPVILGHNINESELAGLYFEIEAGTLGESDVYSDFEKKVEELTENAGMAIRDKAAVNRHEWLQFDKAGPDAEP